jgi:hypothetical protein
MLKRILPILALLLLSLAACRNEPDEVVGEGAVPEDFVPYESETMGLRLQHPEGWVVHRAFNGLTLASSQEVIDGSSLAQIGEEAFVNIIPGELAVFNMQTGGTFSSEQPQEVLERYRALLEEQGQIYTVMEPPEVSNIEGRNVATMVVRSTVEGQTLVTILGSHLNGEYVALSSAGALEAHFEEARPELEQIVRSIEVFPPNTASE